MISQKIKSALEQRKTYALPPFKRTLVAMFAFLFLYLMLCYIGSPADQKEYQFASEDGALTALSSVFLAMGAAFAGVSYFLTKHEGRLRRIFWLMAVSVFIFLAIDELMRMHEAAGWLTKELIGEPKGFRNWNDVIVIGYGIVALTLGYYFLPEILRYPRFFEFLAVAFVFFFIHTFIDSTVEPKTTVSAIFEESAKLLCTALLSFSMFIALIGIQSKK